MTASSSTPVRTVSPRLALSGIGKQYPSARANDDVSLSIAPGEIHAVLGENGAGKSTLMKIVYGAVRPDAGEIRWDGEPVQIASPAIARRLGIGMVFQHFSLFETLTVAENIALALDARFDLKARYQAHNACAEHETVAGALTISAGFRLYISDGDMPDSDCGSPAIDASVV
ncbi:ATP-binding cassette domain-containing protein [Burkholderia cepacia]|uniref:ATP-binding cassette domain-containing protein n=1 Tax=Burkholderia cepacia TaxID=292 RepID=UPI0039BFC7EE